MNIEQLKIFQTLAEKNNFSETAKALHLSQPSVTLQIKSLEERFNAKLFHRTTKRVSLTHAGEILYTHTTQIMRLIDQTEKDIGRLSQTISGELKIGASLTIGEYVLPKILGAFKQQYPDVKLMIEIINSDQIVRKILDRTLHLGFIEAPIDSPKMHTEPFMEDELVIIASGSTLNPVIEGQNEITKEQLKQLPFIFRESGSGTRRVMENALRQHHIDPEELNIVLEVGSTEAIKSTVESGLGISIISKSCIEKEKDLGRLQELRVQNIRIRRFLQTIYHQDNVMKPAEEAFVTFVRENAPSDTFR